ncbi:MAG: tetratricopeptide repeat protein [Campylobacterales bacterium]|nr:tetratricopeptide repeat protein [Campylobacterales bacterium]
MDILEKLEKAIEYHKHNWLEEAEKQYRAVLLETPNHAEANYNLGNLAMQVNRVDLALPLLQKAVDLDSENVDYQFALQKVIEKLEETTGNAKNPEEKNIFELVGNDYVFERKIKSLENKLTLLNDKLNNIHEALNYLDIFETQSFDDLSSRMLPVELIDRKSEKTLIVFGGMASGISMPSREFFKSLSHKNINILFVKDFKQCWYQKGLSGKTHDINSSIAYLQSFIPETSKELITLGASAGGYAAIRFGVGLEANRIMAFSPQTLIDEETASVFAKNCVGELQFGSDDLDLNKVLSKIGKRYNIEVYYGVLNSRDTKNVNHIKTYVEEFAYDTDEHLLAAFLKKQGILKNILDSI